MIVAVARARFHLPAARSLKDKRRVMRSLVDRAHGRLRLSIAETGYQDLHQRSELGVALVHHDRQEALEIIGRLHELFAQEVEAQLLSWDAECIEEYDE